ncbi:hypothetical protein NL676_032018 [Syzygium grande]|nr:hypothetical protein NL676_032018 [Syzygium grande]
MNPTFTTFTAPRLGRPRRSRRGRPSVDKIDEGGPRSMAVRVAHATIGTQYQTEMRTERCTSGFRLAEALSRVTRVVAGASPRVTGWWRVL